MRRALVALLVLAGVLQAVDAHAFSWLGVRIRDLSEQEMEEIASHHGIREGFGVVIVEVLEGTPAAHSGLRAGDIVVAFGERPVTETRMLQRLIAAAPMDAEARLTILRREGRRQLNVRLASMPRDVLGDRVAAEFGFALRDGQPQGELGARHRGRPTRERGREGRPRGGRRAAADRRPRGDLPRRGARCAGRHAARPGALRRGPPGRAPRVRDDRPSLKRPPITDASTDHPECLTSRGRCA